MCFQYPLKVVLGSVNLSCNCLATCFTFYPFLLLLLYLSFFFQAVNEQICPTFWHHQVFPRHPPTTFSDLRQISLWYAYCHCLCSLIDAGMLEVTHEATKSAFHTYSWHLIETIHCLCIWVRKSSSVWSCACTPLLWTYYSLSAVLKCLHYMSWKENVKKIIINCICIYTCPYK